MCLAKDALITKLSRLGVEHCVLGLALSNIAGADQSEQFAVMLHRCAEVKRRSQDCKETLDAHRGVHGC